MFACFGAHSVYHDLLFAFWLIVIVVISHFGFEGGTLVMIALAPGHCLYFTFDSWRPTDDMTNVGMSRML